MLRTVQDIVHQPSPTQFYGTGLWWWTNVKPGKTPPRPLSSDLSDEVYLLFAEQWFLPVYPDPNGLRGGSQILDDWRRGAGFLTKAVAMQALEKAVKHVADNAGHS